MNDLNTNEIDKKIKIRPTKFSNMLVLIDTIEEFIIEKENVYNMTILELCQMVRCERNWTEEFVRPYIHYIFMSEYYLRLLPRHLFAQFAQPSGVGLNREEVEALVKENLVVTRKSISVPLDIFLSNKGISAVKNGDYEEYTIQKFFSEFINGHKYSDFQNENFRLLKRNYIPPSKRAKVKAIPWNSPIDLYNMRRLSDMMDYGDIRETKYRELYEKGMIEADLQLQSVDGKISRVHYFIEPPEVAWKKDESGIEIPFPYEAFLENEKFFSKYIYKA